MLSANFAKVRWLAWISLSALVGSLFGGCGMVGEGSTNAVIEPGKYQFYNCDQLAERTRFLGNRERELDELMERAAQSPGGQVIGAVSYRTELVQTRGYLKQIAALAEQKNCAMQSKRTSDRVLW
jgi:hypothetical protein